MKLLRALRLTLMLVTVPVVAHAEPTTLTGQIVCSACWFEADRSKVAYGTPEDLECWGRCAKKGLPTALAVSEGGKTQLYLLELGRLEKGKGWLPYVGKHVEAKGTVKQGEKPTLLVDEIKTVTPEGGGAASARAMPAVAPEYRLTDLSGTSQTLSSYRGKVVVLNFWATWCVPCRKEIPAFAKVQNAYAPWGIQIIGASADEPDARSAVEAFIAKSKVNFPVWLGATTGDMESFGLSPVLPATVIIDRDGSIVARINGETTEKELKKHLDLLVKAASPAPSPASGRRDPGAAPPTARAAAGPSKRSAVPS